MSERDFKYYRLTGDVVKQIDDEYDLINENRQQVINQAMDKIDAKNVSWSNGWGSTEVGGFAFPIDKEFPIPMKIIRSTNELKVVRAKANSKAGKEFNKQMDDLIKETNKKLEKFPSYKYFLINKFNIQCCTVGTPEPHHKYGIPMISTRAGKANKDDGTLLFAIPNAKEHDKQPEVPECFEEITYGVFYDLADG
ncbi:DUF5420 family protein [Xenorhabdus bovienii]|uniref:DUF5420 family protein n=1 Tax=Xenorhabdus bovienii TaxID=40576 RepID=UPI0023AFF391|nr:DUF5420 family protein [Xenorhabdus bovienii]MDE9477055.1 DUF5420 family protein [Xenorhabdus bovienii]MDE9530034.1 DUF5420 family protein [Xenorhabdus bovienii]